MIFFEKTFGYCLLISYLCRKMSDMPKKEYKRHMVAYKDYFKEFKKTLSLQALNKIYQIFLYIMTLDVVPYLFEINSGSSRTI